MIAPADKINSLKAGIKSLQSELNQVRQAIEEVEKNREEAASKLTQDVTEAAKAVGYYVKSANYHLRKFDDELSKLKRKEQSIMDSISVEERKIEGLEICDQAGIKLLYETKEAITHMASTTGQAEEAVRTLNKKMLQPVKIASYVLLGLSILPLMLIPDKTVSLIAAAVPILFSVALNRYGGYLPFINKGSVYETWLPIRDYSLHPYIPDEQLRTIGRIKKLDPTAEFRVGFVFCQRKVRGSIERRSVAGRWIKYRYGATTPKAEYYIGFWQYSQD